MSTSGTGTRSASFTITDARHVGAKVSADLRMLNGYYGRPSLASIDDYAEEVSLLLRDGYLGIVDYGFRDIATNAWKFRIRFTATVGRQLIDSRPGSLPATLPLTEYRFYSYLTYSASFGELPPSERATILTKLPIQRVTADEPSVGTGSNVSGHGYASNGVGVARDIFTATRS